MGRSKRRQEPRPGFLPRQGPPPAARVAGTDGEERFRVVTEAAPDAIITIDNCGRIVSWNPAAERLFGYPPDAVLGQLWTMLVPYRFRARHLAWLAGAEDGDAAVLGPTIELAALRRDGTELTVELSMARWQAATGIHFTGILRDVTARKKAEAELAVARDQALEASQTKSRFVATVGHEIRSPLAGIVGSAELLTRGLLTRQQRELVDGIRSAGHSLMRVLNDMLDMSKLEAGKLAIEVVSFDPCQLVRDVCRLFRSPAESKGVTLAVHIDPRLPAVAHTDPTRVRQVLTNLLSNAVKFTSSGSVTVLATPGAGDSSSSMRIEVIDTGIGIPDGAKTTLLDPFAQAEPSTARRFGGTGLGLAICVQLTELLDGSFGFDSTEGEGSRFWVELPLRLGTEEPLGLPVGPQWRDGEPPAAPTAARLRRRGLVVDDAEVNRVLGAKLLEQLGYDASTAPGGEQALAALRAEPFDLVLLDCHMPDLDGFETATRIRRLPGAAGQVPIVAVTALSSPSDRRKCFDAGMDGYLAKPLDLRRLADTIDVAVGTVDLRSPAPAAEAAPCDGSRHLPAGLGPAVLDGARLRLLSEQVGPAGLSETILLFLGSVPERLGLLGELLAAGDAVEAALVAHSLRGTAATVGAERVRALSQEVEDACGRGHLAGAARALGSLLDEVPATETALRGWVATGNPARF